MSDVVEDDPTVAILAALRAMAPPGVEVAARRIDPADETTLHIEERAAIASAGEKRRREFSTGRALLRAVIGRDVAIPAGADRRPILPKGVVASLAHDDLVAVAAVSSDSGVAAIGVDIERHGTLEADVADAIVRPDDDVADPVLAFVLKEAAYKAWSGLGGRMLDHHDVRITVSGAAFTALVEPDGQTLRGRFATAAGCWLALVVVPASPDTHQKLSKRPGGRLSTT